MLPRPKPHPDGMMAFGDDRHDGFDFMSSEQETWICVAAVATAHGVHGALKLRCFTERPEDVAAYGPLFTINRAVVFLT